MQVKVTGRHMSVTDAMKSYADEKARKLVKFFDRIQEIRVILDFEGSRPTVECIVDVEHADDFVAHETHDDVYAAIDAVSDKLERQLRRHKEMIKEHHKGRENNETSV
jgi:ribosome hibernation promoting factor